MAEYNINCDIARDLMPLVIDDIASPSAAHAVEAHVNGCAECKKVMEGMRRENALAVNGGEGDTKFIRFCRSLEKRFRWQRALAWACGVIAVVLVVSGIALVVNNFTVPLDLTGDRASNYRLVQDQFGNVNIEITQADGMRPLAGYEGYTEPTPDGLRVYISPLQHGLPRFSGTRDMTGTVSMSTEMRVIDGKLFSVDLDSMYTAEYDDELNITHIRLNESDTPVAELWLGQGDDAILLYKDGDALDLPVVYEAPAGITG